MRDKVAKARDWRDALVGNRRQEAAWTGTLEAYRHKGAGSLIQLDWV